MRPSHLSRLRLPGRDLHDLARLHAEWVIGVGRFAALRADRLAAGLSEEIQPDDIAGEVLKFAVPEPGGVVRTSIVRLALRDGVATVEHLVVRQGPAATLRTASAAAPEVVLRLLAEPGLQPAELGDGAWKDAHEDDVGALVARILASDRDVPLVLVSVDNGSRAPIVDPAALALRLAGMARVYGLATVRASHRLKDELIAAGFSEKFGCYNGGVRILWPGIGVDDDPYNHLLLLPVRVLGIPERARAEQIAGVFCEMIAEDEDPRAWLRDVERDVERDVAADSASTPTLARERPREPQRDDPHARTHREPARAPTPPVERASEPRPAGEPAPPPTTTTTTTTTTPPRAPSESTWTRLSGDVAAALDLAAELERDLDATRRELVLARQALRRAEQQRDELTEHGLELADVATAVAHVEARFSDRLLVLPSAQASAAESQYRDPERLFRVLVLLAIFGQHDGTFADALLKALGHAAEWKPKDSPETCAKFGGQRTWTSADGARKLYARHVTLGGSVSAQRCLQIYYDVLSDARIEIAWIGEHRPTVGKDT